MVSLAVFGGQKVVFQAKSVGVEENDPILILLFIQFHLFLFLRHHYFEPFVSVLAPAIVHELVLIDGLLHIPLIPGRQHRSLCIKTVELEGDEIKEGVLGSGFGALPRVREEAGEGEGLILLNVVDVYFKSSSFHIFDYLE